MESAERRAAQQVMISLAGRIAERIAGCLLRFTGRTKSLHESAHAVMAKICGEYVYEATIIPDPSVRRGGAYKGGHVRYGKQPRPTGVPDPSALETDVEAAARLCLLLSGSPMTWRGALAVYRQLRAATECLLREHWAIVEAVAKALHEHEVLNQDELDALFEMRSGDAAGRDQERNAKYVEGRIGFAPSQFGPGVGTLKAIERKEILNEIR